VEGEYVEGLSGEEIINDVLDQVAQRLHGDCNLRASDSYTGGYDGWVEVHLNLHGMDRTTVKTKIVMGPIKGDDPNQTTVETKVEIPLEPALNLVRERSGQGVPTLSKGDDGEPVVKKRQYSKRSFGGATGDIL
jgi:hypothetical protein